MKINIADGMKSIQESVANEVLIKIEAALDEGNHIVRLPGIP